MVGREGGREGACKGVGTPFRPALARRSPAAASKPLQKPSKPQRTCVSTMEWMMDCGWMTMSMSS